MRKVFIISLLISKGLLTLGAATVVIISDSPIQQIVMFIIMLSCLAAFYVRWWKIK